MVDVDVDKETKQDKDIDELIIEVNKDDSSGNGQEFEFLAVDTVRTAKKIREIKRKLDAGEYKSKDVEELYRLQLMSLDQHTMENMSKMNRLLANENLLSVRWALNPNFVIRNKDDNNLVPQTETETAEPEAEVESTPTTSN
jgi:hypothetical protein